VGRGPIWRELHLYDDTGTDEDDPDRRSVDIHGVGASADQRKLAKKKAEPGNDEARSP
jgi:hypothetical protein